MGFHSGLGYLFTLLFIVFVGWLVLTFQIERHSIVSVRYSAGSQQHVSMVVSWAGGIRHENPCGVSDVTFGSYCYSLVPFSSSK